MMESQEHIERVRDYYFKSRFGYKCLLWGSQHFGYYPSDRPNISEKEAQILMQDLVGKKLRLSDSMKVLDAGCGRGVVASYLTEKYGCSIEAIDITPMLIEEAKNRARRTNVNKVNFHVMDYSNTDFQNEYFDTSYSVETLCHSLNINKTLKELYRILKKGGKIALFEYAIANDEDFSPYELNMLNYVINVTGTEGLYNFRDGKLQNLIRKAGFRKIEVEDITNNVLPSLNRLRKFFFLPYFFVKISNSHLRYPNPTIAVEWYKLMKKGLWIYNIFTACK